MNKEDLDTDELKFNLIRKSFEQIDNLKKSLNSLWKESLVDSLSANDCYFFWTTCLQDLNASFKSIERLSNEKFLFLLSVAIHRFYRDIFLKEKDKWLKFFNDKK